MPASTPPLTRTRLALALLLALGSCDPNVVIGSRFGAGAAGSADVGGAGATAGGGVGGSAGDVAVAGSATAEAGMPATGAAGEAGAGGEAGASVLFSADHENGTKLSQWDEGPDADAGGYYADTEVPLPVYSTDQAHSGVGSVKVSIDTTSGAGVIARLYRRIESEGAAYYSAWFYLQEDHTPDSWWSIFLFRAVQDRNKSIDLWSVDLVRAADDTLTLAVFDHAKGQTLSATGNPSIRVGQWFQLQAYLRVSPGAPSQLTLWLDGSQFLKLDDTTAAPPDQPLYWVVGNGAARLNPPVSTLYLDDAEISTAFIPP